jgi:hypothetical protein
MQNLCRDSLSGLVVKQMLLDNPDFAKKVPFIVFDATPGSGSFLARFGSFFSGDPLLRSMSSSGDNQYPIELENRWRGANYATHRFCAYEDRKMRPHDLTAIITGGTADAASKLSDFIGGMYVVDPGSATYGCDSNAKFTKIDANHLGIVKPTGLGDPIYTLFKKYYESDGRGPITAVVQTSEVRFDKVLCGFYGAPDQRKPAWNADEVCPIENPQSLDQSYKQTVFTPSYKASSKMTAAEILPGLEIETDGGYYWSVDRGRWNEDYTAYLLHTYCGPSGSTEGGCNVKVKIIGHYKTTTSDASPVLK